LLWENAVPPKIFFDAHPSQLSEYRIQEGSNSPFKGGYMERKFLANMKIAAVAVSLFLTSSALATPPAPPAYDFIDAAWASGIQRYIYGSFTTPPASQEYVDVYVIGPIFANHPQDEVTLEPFYPYHHDHVTTKTPYNQRKLARFLIVRPGPNANHHNLLSRNVEIQDIGEEPIPPPGMEFTPVLEAPFAINLGHGFRTLRKTETILDGIDAGILTTIEVVVGVDITGWSGGLAFDTDF
jgi:hypothetical protein